MANPRKRRARARVRREKMVDNWGANKVSAPAAPAAPEKKATPEAPKKKVKAAKAKPKGE